MTVLSPDFMKHVPNPIQIFFRREADKKAASSEYNPLPLEVMSTAERVDIVVKYLGQEVTFTWTEKQDNSVLMGKLIQKGYQEQSTGIAVRLFQFVMNNLSPLVNNPLPLILLVIQAIRVQVKHPSKPLPEEALLLPEFFEELPYSDDSDDSGDLNELFLLPNPGSMQNIDSLPPGDGDTPGMRRIPGPLLPPGDDGSLGESLSRGDDEEESSSDGSVDSATSSARSLNTETAPPTTKGGRNGLAISALELRAKSV